VIENKVNHGSNPGYDYEQIEHVIRLLDYLRVASSQTGNAEINAIIGSAFNLCMSTYDIALQREALGKVVLFQSETTKKQKLDIHSSQK